MDPIDEASELQAIGRAYRIGQQRNTHICRYQITSGAPPQEQEQTRKQMEAEEMPS